MIHTVKGFNVVNEAEGDGFLEYPCFLHVSVNVDNLISGSSDSMKPGLYIWKLLVHTVLDPRLKDFEHNLSTM